MRFRAALTLVLLLSACQVAPPAPDAAPTPSSATPADLRAEYAKLAAAGGEVFTIDAAKSRVLIHIFRDGRAARLGHNHVVSVPKFEAYVHLPSENAAAARFDLRVPVNELVVDDPPLREVVGGSFAGERSASDIEGTRRNMLGPRGLDAAQHPFVHLRSAAIAGDWPVLVADVDMTVRGVTRRQPLVLWVKRDEAGLKVQGNLTLRQTDYGMIPLSLLGGVLSVQDVVVIDFDLRGTVASL